MQRSRLGLAYELTGPPDAPVLALVHGLGLTRATWTDFLPALARDYRVLTYDLAGHGQSALPPEKPGLAAMAGQLAALMDELAIARATIIGFSLGGMINRRFAMDHPARAAALVVLNSPHERSPEAQRLVEDRAARTAAEGPAAALETTLERWFTPAFRAQSPEVVARIRDTVLANDPASYAGHREVLARGVIELIRPEPAIAVPTLVMTCENDSGSTPDMSRAIAREIRGAECVIVPDLQHLGLMERPEIFVEVIQRFLARKLRPSRTQGDAA